MGVYIKGMEMPESCVLCRLECLYRIHNSVSRSGYCPLVEVKTPHGRLIDADVCKQRVYDGSRTPYNVCPTVIEAESDEDCRTCKNYNTEKCNMCGVEADYYEAEESE